MQFKAIEQHTFEDGAFAPRPNNDTVMDSAIVVWSETTISVLRQADWADWPAVTSGKNLCGVYGALPMNASFGSIPESMEVFESIKMFAEVLTHGWDLKKYCQIERRGGV
jgi:hypothetical protein